MQVEDAKILTLYFIWFCSAAAIFALFYYLVFSFMPGIFAIERWFVNRKKR